MNSSKPTRTLIVCFLVCLKISGFAGNESDTVKLKKEVIATRDSVDSALTYAKKINELVRELAEKQKPCNCK